MAHRFGKNNNFFRHRIFFCAALSCFYRSEILFFVQHQLFLWHENFFVNNRLLFVQHQIYFSEIKLFFVQPQIFVLDIVSNVMSWWYIFIATYQQPTNKNIIMCQKNSFLCDTNKLIFVFCASQIFYIQFLHCTLAACWFNRNKEEEVEVLTLLSLLKRRRKRLAL